MMVDGDDGDLQSERHRAICDVYTHARALSGEYVRAKISGVVWTPSSQWRSRRRRPLLVGLGPIVVPSIN
jgi:hypothetical protein